MTDITFGDKMGSEVILIPKIILSRYMFVSCYYIFLYERVLIIHMAYKVFQECIHLVSLYIWPFLSLFVRPSVRPFVNFYIKHLH